MANGLVERTTKLSINNVMLPNAEAGKIIGWDEYGNNLTNYDNAADAANAATIAANNATNATNDAITRINAAIITATEAADKVDSLLPDLGIVNMNLFIDSNGRIDINDVINKLGLTAGANKIFYFPSGTYTLKQITELPTNCQFIGASKETTIIKPETSIAGVFASFTNGSVLKNLTLDSTGCAGLTTFIDNATNSAIEDCIFIGTPTQCGIRICQGTKITRCNFDNCTAGIKTILLDNGQDYATNIEIEDSSFESLSGPMSRAISMRRVTAGMITISIIDNYGDAPCFGGELVDSNIEGLSIDNMTGFNVIHNNFSGGLTSSNTSGCKLSNNSFDGDFIFSNVTGCTLDFNTFSGKLAADNLNSTSLLSNTMYGEISLGNISSMAIGYNRCFSSAIAFSNLNGTNIFGNTFFSDITVGYSDSGSVFSGNTVYGKFNSYCSMILRDNSFNGDMAFTYLGGSVIRNKIYGNIDIQGSSGYTMFNNSIYGVVSGSSYSGIIIDNVISGSIDFSDFYGSQISGNDITGDKFNLATVNNSRIINNSIEALANGATLGEIGSSVIVSGNRFNETSFSIETIPADIKLSISENVFGGEVGIPRVYSADCVYSGNIGLGDRIPIINGVLYMDCFIDENGVLQIDGAQLQHLYTINDIHTIFFRKGKYIVQAKLDIPNVSLIGEQNGTFEDFGGYEYLTIIKPDASLTGVMLSPGSDSSTELRNIMFDCSGNAQVTQILEWTNFGVIDNCYFKGNCGIPSVQTNCRLTNCKFEGNPSNGYFVNAVLGDIENCNFIGNGTIQGAQSGHSIKGCRFEGNPTYYINDLNGSLIETTFVGNGCMVKSMGGGSSTEYVIDCSITGNPTNGYFIEGGSANKEFRNCKFNGNGTICSGSISNYSFIHCSFNGSPNGNFLNGLVYCLVEDCSFSGSPVNGYFIFSYHQTTVKNCTFNGSPGLGMVYFSGQNSRFEYSYLTGGTAGQGFVISGGATTKFHELDINATVATAKGITGAMAQDSELSRCYIHGCNAAIDLSSFQDSRMANNECTGTVVLAQAMTASTDAEKAKLFRNIFEADVTIAAGYYKATDNIGLPDSLPGALPTPSAKYRGTTLCVAGAAGTADVMYVCKKLADDTYSWVQIGE